jgi:GxxExxY protein
VARSSLVIRAMSSSERAQALNQLTAAIIAAAIRVHRQLGPGLLENAYQGCLCYELHAAGLNHELQKPLPLRYKGVTIDCAYRVDLMVERQVLVEVKALDALLPIHSRQLLTYLRLAACPVGLLLNFGASTMKAGMKRIVHEFPA